jgi:hypothetical protein
MVLLAREAQAKRMTALVRTSRVLDATEFHVRRGRAGADRCKTERQHKAKGQGGENNPDMDVRLVHVDTHRRHFAFRL